MILVDFNQVVISALTTAEFGGGQKTFDDGYIKHLVINMLRSYRVKYSRTYGDLVICADASNYWRKEKFPQYKAARQKAKDDSAFDWESIFYGMELVRNDLLDYFPYPVIHVDRCEADDIIATLCEWSQTNDLTETGIFTEEPKPMLIISSDGDLIQNQRFQNVKQYSPKHKKLVNTNGVPIEDFIKDHICEGDTGDGIPNCLSSDNSFTDKIRQKSLRKDRRAEFVEKGIAACQTEDEKKYYIRNQEVIDFRFIPQDIKDAIITEYNVQKKRCDFIGRKKIMSYLIKNRMSLLIEHLSEF